VSPPGEEGRVLLRAEVEHGGSTTVAHTLEVSSDHLLIQMDRWPAVGTHVLVRLSFPRLLEPLALTGRVARHHAPAAPGDVAGITVGLDHDTSAAASRADLAALLARINAPAPDEAAPAVAPTDEYRILLVEDNLLIRDMFEYGLKKYFRRRSRPATVECADDGEQAWNLLCSSHYDLAIVDFYLPVFDGVSLIGRIRHDPVLARLPIVGMSAGGDDSRQLMLKAGADMFLPKPIVLRDLFTTLERLTADRMEAAS
jgi:CheY-like chemotaxis protein